MNTTSARHPVRREAGAALVGGALWILLPVVARATDIETTERGTLAFVAVLAGFWVFGVIAPLLVALGTRAVRSALEPASGRVGAAGTVVVGAGLTAMAVGNGIELASISAGGGTVAAGHTLFLIGFLVCALGGIPLGAVVLRRFADARARTAGVLQVLALPLGIGIGVLGAALDPEQDAWFWAAVAVPTGIAWVLLGSALLTRSSRAVPTTPATAG